MEKYCNFCKKYISFDFHHQWMAHRSNCKENPNLYKKLEKISKAKRKRDNVKNYHFVCKCGDKYSLELTENVYKKGRYKKHCSYSCSNSRKHSEKTIMKISKKLKGRLVGANKHLTALKPTLRKNCLKCGKFYFTKDKNRLYCGVKCARMVNVSKMNSMNIDYSSLIKDTYKRGKKVYGGTSVWYAFNGFKVQGTYELCGCYILNLWKELGKIIDWEYTNDRFQYIGVDGKQHTYLLDFKVFTDDGFFYLEVKGYKKENDELKWNAVKEKGYSLDIWYQNDLERNGMGMVIFG